MAALFIAERGAPFRSHAAPTVSDLLAHRIDAAATFTTLASWQMRSSAGGPPPRIPRSSS